MANRSVHYGAQVQIKAQLDALLADGQALAPPDPPEPPEEAEPWLTTSSILLRKVPLAIDLKRNPAAGEIQLPSILICPTGKERIAPGTNERDDRGYPVMVEIVAADNHDPVAHHDDYLWWREAIVNEFITVGITCADPVFQFSKVDIEPGLIVDLELWQKLGWWVSQLVLVCWGRQVRGNSA